MLEWVIRLDTIGGDEVVSRVGMIEKIEMDGVNVIGC